MKNLKKESGSITLYAVVSMLFFVILLVGIYVNTSYKVQKQQKEIEQIQKTYNKSDINELYEETYQKYKNTI